MMAGLVLDKPGHDGERDAKRFAAAMTWNAMPACLCRDRCAKMR